MSADRDSGRIETIKVGQHLWFVPSDRRSEPHEITVTKVGHKWAQTGHGLRIDLDDLVADGGRYSSPGRAWPSREAWESEKARREAWDALRAKINRPGIAPPNVTLNDIVRANALLGFAALSDCQG